MATYVFVPGGWGGGWVWKRVAERLRSLGHEVFTPTLTGLGERFHLYRDDIDLETHITDVTNVILWEDLHDVILVGHSYGGFVITAIGDRMPERIARLVYMDALWPEDGESVNDIIGAEAVDIVLSFRPDMEPTTPTHMQNAAEAVHIEGVTDPDDVAWMVTRVTAPPPAALVQPLRLQRANSGIPTVFVHCMGGKRVFTGVESDAGTYDGTGTSSQRAEARAAVDPLVRIVTLVDAPHDAMVTHPDELTRILLAD